MEREREAREHAGEPDEVPPHVVAHVRGDNGGFVHVPDAAIPALVGKPMRELANLAREFLKALAVERHDRLHDLGESLEKRAGLGKDLLENGIALLRRGKRPALPECGRIGMGIRGRAVTRGTVAAIGPVSVRAGARAIAGSRAIVGVRAIARIRAAVAAGLAIVTRASFVAHGAVVPSVAITTLAMVMAFTAITLSGAVIASHSVIATLAVETSSVARRARPCA
jgi:hypothetical protein